MERVCHTARRNSRLGFAVISYENKTKPNRLFAERKTTPHWGLMHLEVPVAEFPSVPDSTGPWCLHGSGAYGVTSQAPGLPCNLRKCLLLAKMENNWDRPSVVIIWTLHHLLWWVEQGHNVPHGAQMLGKQPPWPRWQVPSENETISLTHQSSV